MELRRVTVLAGFLLLAAIAQCSDARSHQMNRREANADENYDERILADAAADEDAQNDADGGDDEEDTVDAQILDDGQEYTVGAGKSIRLPCTIDPSPEQHIAIGFQWDKENQHIFLGKLRQAAPSRMNIDEASGSDLLIADVQPSDAGIYRCIIVTNSENSDKKTIVEHTVRVAQPPKVLEVKASDNGLVLEGKEVTITCNVSGSPPPKIVWSREGANQENVLLSEKDGIFIHNSVIIKNIRRDQAGRYICYADNKIGKINAGSANVKVMGKPRVHVHKTVVNSAVNVEAVLQCSAHEEPPSHIRWYKDGQLLEDSATEYTISTVDQTSNLTVTPTTDTDFGTFTCQAENQYGHHNRSIELVQSPVIEKLDVDGPKLTWTVHSHQPLEQIELQLRQLDGDGNAKTLSIPLPEQKSHEYEIVYQLSDNEVGPGKYEAQVNVKNNYNWSGHADPVVVEIETQPLSIQHASVYHGDAATTKLEAVLISTIVAYFMIRLV